MVEKSPPSSSLSSGLNRVVEKSPAPSSASSPMKRLVEKSPAPSSESPSCTTEVENSGRDDDDARPPESSSAFSMKHEVAKRSSLEAASLAASASAFSAAFWRSASRLALRFFSRSSSCDRRHKRERVSTHTIARGGLIRRTSRCSFLHVLYT